MKAVETLGIVQIQGRRKGKRQHQLHVSFPEAPSRQLGLVTLYRMVSSNCPDCRGSWESKIELLQPLCYGGVGGGGRMAIEKGVRKNITYMSCWHMLTYVKMAGHMLRWRNVYIVLKIIPMADKAILPYTSGTVYSRKHGLQVSPALWYPQLLAHCNHSMNICRMSEQTSQWQELLEIHCWYNLSSFGPHTNKESFSLLMPCNPPPGFKAARSDRRPFHIAPPAASAHNLNPDEILPAHEHSERRYTASTILPSSEWSLCLATRSQKSWDVLR